jgi:hypothetical protein
MFLFRDEVIAPVMVFAIPIVAIVGGIIAGIVKTLSRQRLMEVALRERMALLARGVDPAKLSSAADASLAFPALLSPDDYSRLRAQGLLIGGFVTLVAGVAFGIVVGALDSWEVGDWGLGIVAASIGLALIASGLVVWPWRQGTVQGTPGRTG